MIFLLAVPQHMEKRMNVICTIFRSTPIINIKETKLIHIQNFWGETVAGVKVT